MQIYTKNERNLIDTIPVRWSINSNKQNWGGRSFHNIVSSNSSLVLSGGKGSAVEYSDVWMSSDAGQTFSLITTTAPWGTRFDHASVVVDGYIKLINIIT